MIIYIQNWLFISFCSNVVCNKALKARDTTHEFLTFNIPIAHQIRTKSNIANKHNKKRLK